MLTDHLECTVIKLINVIDKIVSPMSFNKVSEMSACFPNQFFFKIGKYKQQIKRRIKWDNGSHQRKQQTGSGTAIEM